MKSPAWLSQLPADVPSELAHWLSAEGSLTQRVIATCSVKAPFSLRVLTHADALAHDDELVALGLMQNTLVRTREVLLQRGEAHLVFAHSVVAQADAQTAWACFEGVGTSSLGSVLFADPNVHAHPLQFLRVEAAHPLYQKAVVWCADSPPCLWARRAVYVREQRPLLVTEVFLSKMRE